VDLITKSRVGRLKNALWSEEKDVRLGNLIPGNSVG
jgi:hypothetical protein